MIALCLSAVARADEPATGSIAAIATSDVDRTVLETVESLGVALTRRELGPEVEGLQVLVRSRDLPEPLVLWIDSRGSSICVLRTEDGALLSRLIARDTFAEAPYVVALAASELIELMRKTPIARAEAPKPTIQEVMEERAQPTRWGSSAFAGAELAAGPRRGPTLFRPAVGMDVLYHLSPSLFADVGLAGMLQGAAVEPLPRGDEGRVQYRRTDVELRLGLGAQRRDTSFSAHLSSGLGFLSAEARGIDDERARTRRRTQVFVGSGLLFRHYVWERVGLTFGLDIKWLTSPARYLVDGQLALEEDSLRIGASLGLLVRLY